MKHQGNFPEEKILLSDGNSQDKSPSIFSSFPNLFSRAKQPPATCMDSFLSHFEVEKSYTIFFIILFLGMGVIMLSLMFLPLAVINPKKFVSLFSLGSLLIIGSFIFIHGTRDFCGMLFSKTRWVLTTLFLTSIATGVFFSFYGNYFIIAYICSIFQFITLVTFVLSFIPGGGMGINFIWNLIKSPFSRQSESYLPS